MSCPVLDIRNVLELTEDAPQRVLIKIRFGKSL